MRLPVELEIATVTGIRKPDIAVVEGRSVRTALDRDEWMYDACDLLLAVEVVSRGSGSEREDRIRKVAEYAASGIPQYWIVDYDPHAHVRVHRLNGTSYDIVAEVAEGGALSVRRPFAVEFDPGDLCKWR